MVEDRKQRVAIQGKACGWKEVLSGVPQGSVFGPLLFTIYINGIDGNFSCKILKFTDDTKMFYRVDSDENREKIRGDLQRLVIWSEDWQMLFNVDKCKAMYIDSKNMKQKYYMQNTIVDSTVVEKDLGILMQNNMF